MKNKLRIFVTILVCCMVFVSNVLATDAILGSNASVTPSISDTTITGWGNDILGYVQFIGWGIAIGMLLYIAIKYMMSAANEKANMKSGSINWVIGALIIGAASTLFGVVTDIFSSAVN